MNAPNTSLATTSHAMASLPQHETAIAASAAHAQAIVQARYVMARANPRDWDNVRAKMLAACKRHRFAETAIYSKPIGRDKVEGPSIRFAEEAARAMGNIDIMAPVLYDDVEKRVIAVTVTDLESNATYSADVTIQKTVERKRLREGQQAKGTRTNSYGDVVYIVEATDDDLLNKQNALVSKAIRTGILRVLPSWIREDAIDAVRVTVERGDVEDPEGARKRIADTFQTLNIMPSDLKKYLGHELATCSPAELTSLRKVYSSIRDGESTWAEHLTLMTANDPAADGEQKTRSQSAKAAVAAKAAEAKEP